MLIFWGVVRVMGSVFLVEGLGFWVGVGGGGVEGVEQG